VSVEVALKLAVQYQAAVGRPARRRFAALRGAYHGDTTGAMSVCDPVDGMHALFAGLVAGQVFLPRPPAARLARGRFSEDPAADDDAMIDAWLAEAERVIAEHEGTIAGIVAEPVLQGAGGMHVYPPRCLAGLRRIADRYGLLLIADEIATGFGRTGAGFGVDWAGVSPDIMCVGKALTGGYLTLAAVLCTSQVAEAVTRSPQRALMHGPTFMANPLACAVASASLELLTEERRRRVTDIGEELADALCPAAGLEPVRDVRVLGAVGVVQLTSAVDVPRVTRAALEQGVWVRPFRDLVYTMPPYIATSEEIAAIGAAITSAVAAAHG
jgi:adenosylmethionine-8-amino-7-oxononanoate aminotransferase